MEIFQKKPSKEIHTIKEGQTVFDAIKKMEEKKLGALVVLDDSSKMSGIISERDYLTKVMLKGHRSSDLHVKDIMAKQVISVSPSTPVRECMKIMTNQRCRHLPLVGYNDDLLGFVSIGDCVKSMLEQQSQTIHYQHEYISGLYSFNKSFHSS